MFSIRGWQVKLIEKMVARIMMFLGWTCKKICFTVRR